MYVCMYVCVYVYMYVCIYLSRHISIHSLIQLNVLFLPRDAPHLSGSSVGRKTSWSTFPPWGRVSVRDIERQCERERHSKRERERVSGHSVRERNKAGGRERKIEKSRKK